MLKKAIIGLLVGGISGFFASGGGLILVPALVHLFFLTENKARATATYVILIILIITSFFYYKGDFINWSLSIKVAIGGMLGGFIGAILLKKISNNILQICFIIFLLYMGIRAL